MRVAGLSRDISTVNANERRQTGRDSASTAVLAFWRRLDAVAAARVGVTLGFADPVRRVQPAGDPGGRREHEPDPPGAARDHGDAGADFNGLIEHDFSDSTAFDADASVVPGAPAARGDLPAGRASSRRSTLVGPNGRVLTRWASGHRLGAPSRARRTSRALLAGGRQSISHPYWDSVTGRSSRSASPIRGHGRSARARRARSTSAARRDAPARRRQAARQHRPRRARRPGRDRARLDRDRRCAPPRRARRLLPAHAEDAEARNRRRRHTGTDPSPGDGTTSGT